MYCFGWQSGGMTTQDGADVILLGGKFHIMCYVFLFQVSHNTIIGVTLHVS